MDTEVHDETLRDGLQCPSVTDPPLDEKIAILHGLEAMGVDSVNVGLPGAGPRAFADALALCQEIATQRMRIRPGCAARTTGADIAPIVELSQRAGMAVEVLAFIGSSPIRQLAETWSLDLVRRRSVEAVSFAVGEGLPATYVTEDTTRSHPDALRTLFRAAIEHGATRVCLCDTVGHATPQGVRNLVRFARAIVDEAGDGVRLDWHGHNDRGLALDNTLWALEHGVDRVHGCLLGIGERVGNAPLDLLLVNLALLGRSERDLGGLRELCQRVVRAMGLPPGLGYVPWWQAPELVGALRRVGSLDGGQSRAALEPGTPSPCAPDPSLSA